MLLAPMKQAVPLDQLVASAMHNRLLNQPLASPEVLVAAFNAALDEVQAAVDAASTSMAALWHWPPPELADLVLQRASPALGGLLGFPPRWWSADSIQTVRRALQQAAVPDLPIEGELGESGMYLT